MLTHECLLTQHPVAYEWSRHALPPTTIKALELLSNSHMDNSLQYTVAHSSPYLVASTGHLRHVSSDLVELVAIKAEREELSVCVCVVDLMAEKHKFEECYNL